MGLFDFFRSKLGFSTAAAQARLAGERIFAVPVAARKIAGTGAVSEEIYLFYGFLFGDSADAAVTRLRKEMRDDGFELLELTGKVVETTLSEWSKFVSDRFDWTKDALPTARQLAEYSRGVVHYSPKIKRL